MCFPFLAARGHAVGASPCARPRTSSWRSGRSPAARRREPRLSYPVDLVIADRLAADAESRTIDGVDVPDGMMGLDIGPRTARGVRARDRGRGHRVLERADGRV